jgi:membrane protein implicated in regulation of membrane protease activity
MITPIIAFVILVALVIVSVIYLLRPATDTAKIRDVFIIFMALQSMLTGITLVILMIQLARLINLLQNEIKPILDSTNETVSNLRGTTTFLSDNLVEPVIKLNEYLAGFSQLLLALGLVRKSKK